MIRLKHFFYTALLTFTVTSFSFGQTPEKSDRFERIENQKVAYITKQLSLSTTEAQRFFPVYNQYTKEHRDIRKARSNMKAAQKSGNSRDVIEFDAREVELKKQYRNKFAEIIGQSRASQFFAVEEEFKEMLYKEWKNRQNKEE